MTTSTQKVLWGRVWNRGNYCEAYETRNFEIAVECYTILLRDCFPHEKEVKNVEEILEHAFTLGFFASYEANEIPEQWRAAYECAVAFGKMHGFLD